MGERHFSKVRLEWASIFIHSRAFSNLFSTLLKDEGAQKVLFPLLRFTMPIVE